MSSCENCSKAFKGKGFSYGRFCSQRCYHTAWTRAKHHADPAAYREQMRRYREDPEARERQREANRRSAERNRERIAARQRAWYAVNREKADAERTARYAVADGRLEREPCLFCDDDNVQAHHHDYGQPLAVTWLCAVHHGLVHRKQEARDGVC